MPDTAAHLKRAERRLGAITWLLGGIAGALILLGLWSVHLTSSQNHTISAIQQSRIDITWKSCQDQNKRHDRTIFQLDRQLLLALHLKPARTLVGLEAQIDHARHSMGLRKQLVQTHDFTVLLIEALAPHQDCAVLLVKRFGAHHRKPAI